MKTFKEVPYQKIVIWSLVVMFSFLQIVPTGWAATRPVPVDELQGQSASGSVDALANSPATPKPASVAQQAMGFADSTAFQLNDRPLSPATVTVTSAPATVTNPIVKSPVDPGLIPEPKPVDPGLMPEPVPTPIPSVVTAVKANLVRNLGITATQLEAWLKAGLIKIGAGGERGTVMVSFSETLRSQYDSLKNTNLFDPTGASGLPKSIEYHYVSLTRISPCSGSDCSAGRKVVLGSAIITNWNGTLGIAKYSKGVLQKVDWYRNYRADEPRPMIACTAASSPSCGMAKARTVTYRMTRSTPEFPNPAHLLVTVVYHDGRAISKLTFEIGKMADGKNHILKVREYNKNGKLLVTSEFKYLVAFPDMHCLPNTTCVAPPALVQLTAIVRKNANGKLLSTIQNIRKAADVPYLLNGAMPPSFLGGYTGDVVMGGKVVPMNFRNLANLLGKVRKLEQIRAIPPAVKAYVSELRKQVGNGFKVTARLQKDGTYLISITDSKRYITVPTSGLKELSFKLRGIEKCSTGSKCVSAGFVVDPISLKVHYYSQVPKVAIDAQLLFEGLMKLQNYCPPGANCLLALRTDPRQAIVDMTRITEISTGGGLIHFSLGNKSYRTYRDFSGNVILEEALPPAVQAYVDALKKTLGTGFNVTATLQANGTYLVNIGRMNACPPGAQCVAPAPGTFGSLQFNINKNGIVNRNSAKAHFNGIEVNGKLLFDAMAALEASFHPKGSAWMPPPQGYIARLLQLASQITVKKSGTNLLRFDHNGKSYKASRDANGNIKLEQIRSIPPAVKAYVSELRKQVGNGFKVTARLQKDGSYLISITDSKRYITVPTSGLKELSFTLRGLEKCSTAGKCELAGFVVDPKSLQVQYYSVGYGKAAIDAQLLFEGLMKLQNYCAPGADCSNRIPNVQRAIADMTRITVISSGRGLIQFTLGNKSYRTYRDASGKVILEELPPIFRPD